MQVPALLLTLLSAKFMHPGREKMMAQGTWIPATHAGELDELLGSWLQPGAALAITGIWAENHWMGKSLSFILSLPLCLSNEYK